VHNAWFVKQLDFWTVFERREIVGAGEGGVA